MTVPPSLYQAIRGPGVPVAQPQTNALTAGTGGYIVRRRACRAQVNLAAQPDQPGGGEGGFEAEDGSAQEWMSCTLSDEPVMIPENEGTAPATPVVSAGGECVWTSDYWSAKDGSEVKAAAFQVTVLPGGQVFAWSSYPAEPLDCPAEE